MKDFIVTLQAVQDVETFLLADSFLIGNERFATRIPHSFSEEEMQEIKQKTTQAGKRLYMNVNRIFFDDDLEAVEAHLLWIKQLGVDAIFFSDMAVFVLARKLGMVDKLVYYSETQMVNYQDCQLYLDLGIQAVILSKETTLDDMLITSGKVSGKTGILIHGYFHMFYSKRKVLRNYYQKYELDGNYHGSRKIRLKEKTREDLYPVYEDDFGSNIFSGHCLSSLKDFKAMIDSPLKMFILDSIFLEQELVVRALEYYHAILEGKDDDYQALLQEEFPEVPFGDGFLHHKTDLYK